MSAMTRSRLSSSGEKSTEGGRGIVILIATHLSNALLNGILTFPGVMYISWQAEFGTDATTTSAVQSVLVSIMLFSGVLGGAMTKRFGCRLTGMFGGALMSLGLFASYFVTSITQLYITTAILATGIGVSCNPGVFIVAMYFEKHYGIANGLTFSGCGTGTTLTPLVLQFLMVIYGWRGTLLIMSGILAHVVALGALYRPPKGVSRHVASIESATSMVLSNPTPISRVLNRFGLGVFSRSYGFALLCLTSIQFIISSSSFYVLIVPRAQLNGIAPSSAVILLSVLGIGDFFGRLSSCVLTLRISAEHVITAVLLLCGVAPMIANVDSYACYLVAALIHGFATGCLFTVVITLIKRLVGMEGFAVSYGISQLSAGIGGLIGPVFSGWLYDQTADYDTVFYTLAVIYFACAVQMMLLPLLKRLQPPEMDTT